MNYWRIVKKTLQYIKEHLKDDISLDKLSRNAGYSEYHFSRVFKSEIGLPIMDYVRKRRLIHALAISYDLEHINQLAQYGVTLKTA